MAERVQQKNPDRVAAYAIKFVREIQGLSREDFADKLTQQTGDEWSETMVVNLETGRKTITAGILYAVSEILNRDMDWFVTAGTNGNTGFPDVPSDLRELVA